MQALRPEEEWALQMVERELGVNVVQHDDGSAPSMYDLRIEYPNCSGAVEVVSAADPDCHSLWKVVGNSERWIEESIVGGWTVHLRPKARGRRVYSELPSLLDRLERSGVRSLVPVRRGVNGSTESALFDLGVASVFQYRTSFPGSIYMMIEEDAKRRGGWEGDAVPETLSWIGDFLDHPDRRDVRRKLGSSGCTRRQVFVVLPVFTTAPFGATLLMTGLGGSPEAPPRLPAEITDLWLVSTHDIGTGWRWSPEDGWKPFDKCLDLAA